jgi:hypothetical protein
LNLNIDDAAIPRFVGLPGRIRKPKNLHLMGLSTLLLVWFTLSFSLRVMNLLIKG